MHSDKERIITRRVLLEMDGARSVALGPGVPEALVPLIEGRTRFVRLADKNSSAESEVDLAVVEAYEVSQSGDLVAAGSTRLNGLQAGRWVVASPIQRSDGGPVIVRQCSLPVHRAGCVELVVTELGVLEIGKIGFELKELAPGYSSDDVRGKVRASVHVADGIERLKLV